MATWECGRCHVDFASHHHLQDHMRVSHGENPPPTRPVPASAPQKRIPPGPAPDAQTLRTGDARGPQPGADEEPHPTGLKGPPAANAGKGRPPT